MRVALAQVDATVGDLRGNLEKIKGALGRAAERACGLAVFPEQCLGGYPALDLWEEPGFVRANQEALQALAKRTGETACLVGFVAANKSRRGKPVHNAAALLHRGKVVAVRHKTLLPTYDVFDEARYFEPAKDNKPVKFMGTRLGISICEDAWARDPSVARLYPNDPLKELAKSGASLLVNLSASPFGSDKPGWRLKLFADQARRLRLPFLYCNMVGGNDEIILDGHSLVLDAKGRCVARGAGFGEDLVVVDTERLPDPLAGEVFAPDIEQTAGALTLGIRDYAAKCGFKNALVGLSGGIDSALTCALAVRALGANCVTGVSMPSEYSSESSLEDAQALASNLGVRWLKLPIQEVFESYRGALGELLGPREGLPEQNLQARIRGNFLMALSNREGALLLSTGNKSEMSVGYCTLYGDMSGGLAVLADVPKKTVYALSRWLNREAKVIPESSIEKLPSAELKPHQFDQDDLPPYDALDAILAAYVEQRRGPAEIAAGGFDRGLVDEILRRIDRAEYKRRQAPPSLKISGKSFGIGRRMPIARGSYR
ncbi:MAG: NAD+ synthase [Elusimicrobia bacterium]|nr:NAD+ synthase [Elusimicrobiota bacterium]